MNVKFFVHTKSFEDALVKYRIVSGQRMQAVIRQQMRLVAEKLIRFTPPKRQSSGNRNVENDIKKVFADLGDTQWQDKSLQKLWRAGNFEGVKAALSAHPNKEQLPVFQYSRIFKEAIPAIHQAAINRARGRVPKRWRTIYAVGTKGALKTYIRKVQKHVGVARSGWMVAVLKLGGKVPQWVLRHGTGQGEFIDRNSGINPYMAVRNKVKTFPKGRLPDQIMERAIRAQQVAMERNIRRILREQKL